MRHKKKLVLYFIILLFISVFIAVLISLSYADTSRALSPTMTPWPLKPTVTPNIPDPSDWCYYPQIPNYDIDYCQMVYIPMVEK